MITKRFAAMLMIWIFVAATAAAFPLRAAHAGCGGPNDPNPCPEGGGEPEKKDRPTVEFPSFTPTEPETPTASSTPLPSATPTATIVPSVTATPRATGFLRPDPCEPRLRTFGTLGIGLLMSAGGILWSTNKGRRTPGRNAPKPRTLYESGKSIFDEDLRVPVDPESTFESVPGTPFSGGWRPPFRLSFRTPAGLTAFGGLALTAASIGRLILGGPC